MNVNRRTALGVLGAVGAGALASNEARAQELPPPLILPPAPYGEGARGRMTGAKAAVAALRAEANRCVYGVPGAQNNEFWDAMKGEGLPYLLVTNESSASVMADAAARVTGEVGVFCVVPGPGLTNAMTGIGEALHDSIPIVGIVTDVLRGPHAKIGQVHGLPNAAILRPICKTVLEVQHQAQIPSAIHHAFRLSVCGEPGPVTVVIPFNFLTETWNYDCPVPPPLPASFDEGGYRRALAVLSDRRLRVGIYAGLGCVHATQALAAVAETLQAPVATSVSGKGVISDAHPLAVGWGYGPQGTRAAEKVFKDVDAVLAVGVKYSEVSTANYSIPEHKVIHVDANPNNLGRNVPTCVEVAADSRNFLDRLMSDANAIRRTPSPPLWSNIKTQRDRDRREYARVRITAGVDPMVFLYNLRRALRCDALMFIDVTASTHWASEVMEVNGPRLYFTPANNQSMGWAVPAAVGAQRLDPSRQVASVVGDGCFLMSGLEASTAARSALPVKFFILDDGAYHYMQMLQEPTFRRTTATEIARLDFAALAKGLNLAYNCIGHNDDIAAGIARSLACPTAVLTRVVVSYDGREIRWLNALKKSYIDNLSNKQKVRMASRIVTRSMNPRPNSD
ncbi:MAG: thiamine pyrophosphate-dependent enzyme possible carboligase or decarboxylase [Planctomycetota bacterium]|nr:thiamine pyrophosphate-dependent enzyme possible carboligase or decarboxylase [Planctomycetota bacterium]